MCFYGGKTHQKVLFLDIVMQFFNDNETFSGNLSSTYFHFIMKSLSLCLILFIVYIYKVRSKL